ncbi:type II toxin-antitoxin system VapC family toxin [Meiothermus sp. CFH 77666]|uniref:type II toxin-antitoxin system VapC family toxin n=1 Tax=Meiothermus sp. CFH 77666 TaxID=2817942 RepID=UPI001AA025E5|nr:type II toxin-antitoxin system VapC family toxin [Meiothermus sp. CFH 77666]MBO1438386.1 type II toxin-antitoxin system VapC family toxin [Meiothermus sp. CFH 77666]
MITALDTNILIGLWLPDHPFNQKAERALEAAAAAGSLIITPMVYAELLAAPGKTRLWVEEFLDDVGIRVDWNITETSWLEAGEAFADYAHRRRKQTTQAPRRILADFVIGAHALHQADRLLSTDGWYKTIYKRLRLEVVR